MLTFEPDGHIYRWDGKRVPNVTSILKDQGMLVISEWSTGPDTGKAVHEAVHSVELGCFKPKYHPECVKPYLDAYAQFKAAVNFKGKATELRVYSEAWGYAGCLDLLGLVHDDRSLVDIKTGVVSPATAVQVAAYWGALSPKDQAGVHCYTLYLKGDGKYKLVPIEPFALLEAHQDFIAALRTYRFRERHGLLGEGEICK